MLEPPPGLRTVSWDLPKDLAMVSKTRKLARETLISWHLDAVAEDVTLVIGELLANAVLHGAAPIRLSLWSTPATLSLRITDHGPNLPRPLNLAPEALHGRGLAIVAALAPSYGITPIPNGPGKTIWATWPTPERTQRWFDTAGTEPAPSGRDDA